MLKIIADSTCNLPPELLARHQIPIAPIAIQFGEQSFDEFLTIDRDLFYRKIEETGTIPTTSQPSPAWFAELYRQAAREGAPVLVLTVTGKHSGTYQSAVLARSMVPEADVEVFDSASISLGTGWMVLEAARLSLAGRSRSAILQRLTTIRRHSHLYLTPATLKYLQMSGRVGRLQGAIASLLNVKPIIILKQGVLEARENVRTRGKAIERLVSLAKSRRGLRAGPHGGDPRPRSRGRSGVAREGHRASELPGGHAGGPGAVARRPRRAGGPRAGVPHGVSRHRLPKSKGLRKSVLIDSPETDRRETPPGADLSPMQPARRSGRLVAALVLE
jgi:DegV family protein with EDD domain